MTKGDLRFNYY
ncbi:uncharacterized protein FFNC_15512 [Fusarium fujikuroi]|nr:uncharacterized protein FFNC_15512 [Fusarium fujikuroi]